MRITFRYMGGGAVGNMLPGKEKTKTTGIFSLGRRIGEGVEEKPGLPAAQTKDPPELS